MPKKDIDELFDVLEDFKGVNDARLDKIEKGQRVSGDLEEKLDKMNDAISGFDKARLDGDAMEKRLKEQEEALVRLESIRSAGGTVKTDSELASDKYRKSFVDFVRKGVESETQMKEDFKNLMHVKAVTGQNGPDGGFAIPEELDRQVYDLLRDASPMRGICRVITTGTPDYKKLVGVHGATTGWVGEESARPETTSPTLAEVSAVNGEIYSAPKATQNSLDDMFFNVEGWLASELSSDFALAENAAFTTGDGVVKPRGFLDYTLSADVDGTRAFGQLQSFSTGSAGAFKTTTATVNPADDLIDMVQGTKQGHRAGSIFMMNTLTVGDVRKFKDNDGAYIWEPGIQAGEPSSLLGFSLIENEDIADVATDSLSVVFGNFQNGYYIVDRAMGTRLLRDPYTDKPYVVFYTTKRVGGMVVDSEAIKVLQFSA